MATSEPTLKIALNSSGLGKYLWSVKMSRSDKGHTKAIHSRIVTHRILPQLHMRLSTANQYKANNFSPANTSWRNLQTGHLCLSLRTQTFFNAMDVKPVSLYTIFLILLLYITLPTFYNPPKSQTKTSFCSINRFLWVFEDTWSITCLCWEKLAC